MKYDNSLSSRLTARTVLGVLLLLPLLASGCLTVPSAGRPGRGQDLPAWYFDPAEAYPEKQYLAAVGSGDSRKAAEEQALAGLAGLFAARVEVDYQVRERYREIAGAAGVVTDEELEITRSIGVTTAGELLNVRFGEAAVDEWGMVHTIAYLDRLETGWVYRDIMGKNSAAAARFLAQAAREADILDRFALTSAAAVIAAQNEVLADQLRIISPGLVTLAVSGYDYQAIAGERTRLAAGLRAAVRSEGDYQDRLEGVLSEMIGAEGFEISMESPALILEGRLEVLPVELNPDFRTVRWVLKLTASRSDGTGLASLDTQGRASGITDDAAAAFAYRDIREAIENEFMPLLRRALDRRVLE